jgi:hypothetical protein
MDGSVGIAKGYKLDGQGSIPGRDKRFFSLLHCVWTGPGSHPASYPMGSGRSFLEGKAAGDYSSPSNAEVRNGGAVTQLPHTSSWCGA